MALLSSIGLSRATLKLLPLFIAACSAADTADLGPRPDLYACEGCESALEADPSSLDAEARIADQGEPGEPMILSGTVFQSDGRTPASDVVIYAHHTDATGIYPGGDPNLTGSARDGRLHGWLKTGADGSYRFETIKPAPYPDMTMPAHIHLYVAEPGRRPYYIDDVVFAGEFGVDEQYRNRQELRGGSGIVTLVRDPYGRWIARRNIVLERHP